MRNAFALVLLMTATTAVAEPKVRHPFSSSIATGTVRRVLVDIPAGDIEIRNGAPDRLTVSGYAMREPDGPRSDNKEQRIVNDVTVEIYASNDEAIVRRRFGPEADGFRGEMFTSVKLVLEVPVGMSLELETRFGDVRIDGSFGDVTVDLRAGEIDLRMPQRDVRELEASCRIGEVHTRIGGQIVERQGLFPGKTRYVNPDGRSLVSVHTTTGQVRVELTR